MTNGAYTQLGLVQLSKRKFDLTTTALRDDILHFYSDLSAAIDTKKDDVRWQSVMTALDQLKSVTPVRALAASPTEMTSPGGSRFQPSLAPTQ